ncbi:ethyl tert-butyl ether degradation EthD (plasmid) [Scytonema sp. HK-05]|uniref:EthD domain-containing protein n=1 Tax=Scytonema sp. HK-05 TaxID=1137095 RepID=UPI0009F9B9AE|nr:EthD domain-containing protein [Scytonema sp. HK-05]BAY50072.1 ethyl tert-butyl ether degradation EthD [Scytonema sp. HK-05]
MKTLNQETAQANYASRDRTGKAVFYVLLWKRKGITLNMFDDYWRNVHGPVCARLPGQYQYWQFHVAHNQGGIWPTLDGIDYNYLESDQFDGIAELTFATENDRQTWFNASGILMDDEYNIFSKAIGYNTSPGNSQTYVDGISTGDPNGELGIPKFHVMVKKADGVSVEAFRKYMKDSFAPAIVKSNFVLKFRLHLFEEVDNSRPDAPGVIHVEPPKNQYQAAFEIAFSNFLDMANFFASDEYTSTFKSQPKYIKQINTFPERAAYTFVYNGQLTIAGQRSCTVAELITNIGAINQLKKDVVSLMSSQFSLSNGKQNIKPEQSVSDNKVSSQTTNQKSNMLERLPGTASEIVTRLFARGEAFDSEGFIEFFTDTPVYQFGNFPPCFTKAAIKQSVDAFFSQVSALYHEIKMMWEVGEVVFVEMDVIYWRKDGSVVTLPCCDIFRLEGDKFSELRIFMDANPVSDETIPVPSTSSVLTISQGQRLTPPGILRKYFSEHDEGKKRVATGFAPKWSDVSSKWSLAKV